MLSDAVIFGRWEPFTVEEWKEKMTECWDALFIGNTQDVILACK